MTRILSGLVKYKSNTLNDKDPYFTTLATLAECNVAILGATFPEKIDRDRPTEKSKEKLYQQKVLEVWQYLVENIDLFSDLLEDKDEMGDDKRHEIRRDFLLGKPVPQVCLVTAFARLTGPDTNLSYEQAVEKLNRVDWKKDAPEWDRLFISGDKIITKNRKLVTDILCYRAGQKLGAQQTEELLGRYQALFPEDEKEIKAKELPPLL